MTVDRGRRNRLNMGVVAAIAVAVLAALGVGRAVTTHNTATTNHRAAAAPSPSASPSASPSVEAGSGAASPASGSTPATQPGATAGPGEQPTGGPTADRYVITEFSQGPVRVKRGTLVEVDMASSNPAWREPSSADANVLQRQSASTAADGSARAIFLAVGAGSTTVMAVQAPASCAPKCQVPQRAWEITVEVTG